jgi:serine/threonine-protein kinase
LKHDRRVALKVLRPELSAILGSERFLSEIRVTANLQHPHILPLFDSGSAKGLLYYVMPFVQGESLREKLQREKQLAVDHALRIATQVAAALDYAHRHGIIHRDIKPENILLQEGQASVADFGIALALRNAGGTRLTETGISMGTPQYMSPEQATGDRELDARSDVYALGCVLFEMLAGEPPHTGPTVQAVPKNRAPSRNCARPCRSMSKQLSTARWPNCRRIALRRPANSRTRSTNAVLRRCSAGRGKMQGKPAKGALAYRAGPCGLERRWASVWQPRSQSSAFAIEPGRRST